MLETVADVFCGKKKGASYSVVERVLLLCWQKQEYTSTSVCVRSLGMQGGSISQASLSRGESESLVGGLGIYLVQC